MDPLLVITNSDAGTSDQETLEPALAILREAGSVEVAAHLQPRRARRRPAPRRVADASWWPAATAACTRWSRRSQAQRARRPTLGPAAARHRQRLRPRHRHPPRHRGGRPPRARRDEPRPVDLIVDETGSSSSTTSTWASAPRPAARRTSGSTASARSASARSTSASSATPSAPCSRPSTRRAAACASRSTARWSTTSTSRVLMVAIGNGANVGGGTEITPDADPENGWLDVMISRAISPGAKLGYVAQLRKGEHHERDDVRQPPRLDGLGERRGVLGLRGRRDLRPRAQPDVAHRAGGVHDGAAPLESSPAARPRRRPGSGCRRPGRSSAPRSGAAPSAG